MKPVSIFLLTLFLLYKLEAQEKNLSFYLTQGIQNSPILTDYQNRILSSHIDSMKVRASGGLQVTGKSLDYYAPVIHGWGYDEIITDGTNVQALVEVSKEFSGRRNLQNKYHAIQIRNEFTRSEASASQTELRKSIIAHYIDTYGNQQEYEINRKVLDILKEEEKLVKTLTEKGIYKQTQYLSFVVILKQQSVTVAQNFNQCAAGLGALNYLCGIYDTAWVSLPDPAIMPYEHIQAQHSVFYRQFFIDSLRLATENKTIDFNYRPKLSMYVDGGYFSSLAYTPWKNFGGSAGLSLTVPIYDGRQRKLEHDQVALAEQTRAVYSNSFGIQYRQQTDVLYRQLKSVITLEKEVEDQITFAGTLVEANQKLLNAGDISITDYLLSLSNYRNALSLMIENKLSRYRIVNEINYWNQTR